MRPVGPKDIRGLFRPYGPDSLMSTKTTASRPWLCSNAADAAETVFTSKAQLHRKLNLTRRERGRDLAECRVGYIARGCLKICLIQRIEHLCSELETPAFARE